VVALLLVLVPFLDRGAAQRGRSPVFTAIGVVALVYMIGLTAYGYRSLTPIYVVLATFALVAVLGLGTRRGGGERP